MTEAGSKLQQLVRSRKAWATAIALGVSIVLWRMGEISGSQLATVTGIAASVYVGSVALEDGLRGMVRIWMQVPDPDTGYLFSVEREPTASDRFRYGEGKLVQ